MSTNISVTVCFMQEFNLMDKKELAPLQELSDKFTAGER